MMIYPDANCGSRPFNCSPTARSSADLKGSSFQLLYFLLRVVSLGASFEYGARVFFEASPECFRDRLYFDGGAVASPLVLAVFAALVAEVTAVDAVTGETIAATDGDSEVFFPFFFLIVMVSGAIFRGAPRFRFFKHPVINPLTHPSRIPVKFIGIVGGFSVSR